MIRLISSAELFGNSVVMYNVDYGLDFVQNATISMYRVSHPSLSSI